MRKCHDSSLPSSVAGGESSLKQVRKGALGKGGFSEDSQRWTFLEKAFSSGTLALRLGSSPARARRNWRGRGAVLDRRPAGRGSRLISSAMRDRRTKASVVISMKLVTRWRGSGPAFRGSFLEELSFSKARQAGGMDFARV